MGSPAASRIAVALGLLLWHSAQAVLVVNRSDGATTWAGSASGAVSPAATPAGSGRPVRGGAGSSTQAMNDDDTMAARMKRRMGPSCCDSASSATPGPRPQRC